MGVKIKIMKNYLPNYERFFWILLILSSLIFTTKSFSEEANLKINISNLEKPGVLYFSICRDQAGFEKTVKGEAKAKTCINSEEEIDLKNPEINFILHHGEYAITLFVDFNGNKEMDKNFLGIPKEPYGFSNNVIGKMSAPPFDQAKFLVAGPTMQNIELRIGIPKQD